MTVYCTSINLTIRLPAPKTKTLITRNFWSPLIGYCKTGRELNNCIGGCPYALNVGLCKTRSYFQAKTTPRKCTFHFYQRIKRVALLIHSMDRSLNSLALAPLAWRRWNQRWNIGPMACCWSHLITAPWHIGLDPS